MFISTVIPSTMLDATKNLNNQPYNFSVPYNFVRGRNLVININPAYGYVGDANSPHATLVNKQTVSSQEVTNRIRVNIPDNVTEYNTTMQVTLRAWSGAYTNVIYNLNINFNITLGIITITPVSVIGSTASNMNNDWATVVLVNIATQI